ncbi:MAG: hypothetical protein AAF721_37620 [Myxococcota bacterium]
MSGERGAVGDPCEFVNVCDPGNWCVDPSLVPTRACEHAGGCCTAVCNVGDDSPCLPGQTCQPWYEDNAAPPGQDRVGICARRAQR